MTLLDVAGWLDELSVVCDANRAVLGDGTVADEYSKESRRFKAAAAGMRELADKRYAITQATTAMTANRGQYEDQSLEAATDAALEACK